MFMKKVTVINEEKEIVGFILAPESYKDSQILSNMYQTNVRVRAMLDQDISFSMHSEMLALPEDLYPEWNNEDPDAVVVCH